MFCDQMKVYLVFILVQSILSVAIAGAASIEIFGPLVFLGILFLLCKYKHFTIANVLVALAVVLGIIVDIYALSNQRALKHIVVAKAVNREGMDVMDKTAMMKMAAMNGKGVKPAPAGLEQIMIKPNVPGQNRLDPTMMMNMSPADKKKLAEMKAKMNGGAKMLLK